MSSEDVSGVIGSRLDVDLEVCSPHSAVNSESSEMAGGKRDEDKVRRSRNPRLGWTAQEQARTGHRCVWSAHTLMKRTAAPLNRVSPPPHPTPAGRGDSRLPARCERC